MEDKTTEVDIEEIIETIIMKDIGVGLEIDGFQIIPEGTTEAVAVYLDQVQELALIGIGLDVIRVEYDHFARECLTSKIEKETEQIQWMYNMDEEQTSLKTLATHNYDNLN